MMTIRICLQTFISNIVLKHCVFLTQLHCVILIIVFNVNFQDVGLYCSAAQ